MFAWFGLWSAIKNEAVRYANGQLRGLLSKLKAMRDATLADLRSVMSETGTQLEMKLIQTRTRDRVSRAGTRDSVILYSVPVSAFAQSSVVARALAARLAENTDLEAARNSLGITTADWKRFLRDYSATFLKFTAKRALKELSAAKTTVFGNEVIVAVEDKEAYLVDGITGYHDMVKFYLVEKAANRTHELRLAQRLWKKRMDAGYLYERHI